MFCILMNSLLMSGHRPIWTGLGRDCRVRTGGTFSTSGKEAADQFFGRDLGLGAGRRILQGTEDGQKSENVPFLKSVYYEDGSRHEWFQNWSQTVWMLILAGCFLSFFDRKNDGNSPAGPAALLALMGLTLFVLLFEARARYLYCYVPVFVLLSVSDGKRQGSFWQEAYGGPEKSGRWKRRRRQSPDRSSMRGIWQTEENEA